MSRDFTIRKLRVWEIPGLLAFKSKNDYHASSETHVHPESLLHAFLKALWYGERMVNFVAMRDEKMLGYLNLVLGGQSKFKGNAYVAQVAVSNEMRGQGIGTELLKTAEQYAKNRGAHRLELEVFQKNTGAIKLYERLGYLAEGVKRQAVQNDQQYDDLVFMAKLLN
jgi:ribosomal protein S18 acetylase RimI-like enzyme